MRQKKDQEKHEQKPARDDRLIHDVVPAADHIRLFAFWVAGLVLLGTLFRILFLGRASFFIDEINVVRDAMARGSIAEIYTEELKRFVWYRCMPLFLVPIRFFGRWLGDLSGPLPAEWTVRLPFALIGSLALPLYYLFGRVLFGRRTGLWAMFLCAFSVYHIYYSREAYAYSFLLFFAVGVWWCGVGLLKEVLEGKPFSLRYAAGMVLFATGLLQTHLTGVIFLSCWYAVLGIGAWLGGGWRALFSLKRITVWGCVVLIPYIAFSPFLYHILFEGYTSTDHSSVTDFSMHFFLSLFGRMGWGEGWFVLWPFIGSLVLAAWGMKQAVTVSRRLCLAVLIQIVFYTSFQAVYQTRTNTHLEIRYFSAVFPALLVFSAYGLHTLTGLGVKQNVRRMNVRTAVIVLLLAAWLLPSVWATMRLSCRGFDYKGLARWLGDNMPEQGIYAQQSVYELRGVPYAYPTANRQGTFVQANSTAEDFRRNPPAGLTQQLFTRFPTIYLVETAAHVSTIDVRRDLLFMNQVWLGDTAWDRLVRLKTHPVGEVQLYEELANRTLVSYNRPDDLPDLARRNGRTVYHWFGSGWQYVKQYDPRNGLNNDWMGAAQTAEIVIGNISTNHEDISLRLQVLAEPNPVRLTISGPGGTSFQVENVQNRLQEVRLPFAPYPPGETHVKVNVTPVKKGLPGNLFVYDIKLETKQVNP